MSIVQSTPMIQPTVSRISALPMAFQLSPIIHYSSPDYENSENINTNTNKEEKNTCSTYSALSRQYCSDSNESKIEPSTWIGGIIRYNN